MPTTAGGTAASEWRVGDLLLRGKQSGVAIGTGVTITQDVDCSTENELSVLVEMTGAASGDLGVTVIPFHADNVTPYTGVTIPAQVSNGPTFASPVVTFDGVYDVSAYPRVRIAVKNNNAGAQTVNELAWRLAPNS